MGNLASLFKNCTCNVQIDDDENEKELKYLKKEINTIKRKISRLEQNTENKYNSTNQKIDNLEMKLENKLDIFDEKFSRLDTKLDTKFDLILLSINK